MAGGQRVLYEALPGTRYDQYVFRLRQICAFAAGPEGGPFKPFRDMLRKAGVWEKERAEVMLSLVDLSWDRKQVTVGPLAAKIAATLDDTAVRTLLYERLVSDNILLVKYVLEALDVESGGRLHSVHELYRMVTSYVYPGEYITLPNFQAWMEWMAATAYIKLVGIRWALGDPGLEVLGELKAMDVEEIMEDLEDAASDEDEDEDEDEASTPAPVVAAPAVQAAPEPELDDPVDDGMPPEPEPPSEADIAAADAAFMARFADVEEAAEAAAAPATPRSAPVSGALAASAARLQAQAPGLHLPVVAPAPVGPARLAIPGDPGSREVVSKIIEWWQELNDWPALTAPDLGVEVLDHAPPTALSLELAVMAVLVEGQRPNPQVFAFVNKLRSASFFAGLVMGEHGYADAMSRIDTDDAPPWTRPFVERLVHARRLATRVAANPQLLDKVGASESGAAAVTLLREEVFGEAWVEAPFWMLRELLRLKVVTNEALASGAVVPSKRLITNAVRIGLVPSGGVASFGGLLGLVEAVAALFGPEAGYGEALEVMDRALGV